jgi:uncharacterized protein (TIGR02145 family)
MYNMLNSYTAAILSLSTFIISSCGNGSSTKSTDKTQDCECDSSIKYGSEVRIGSQVWTTTNLNVVTFRNGDTIPEAKSEKDWETAGYNKQPAWCYNENNAGYGVKYGKLYNWYAVNDPRGLAPNGWHIPSDAEWSQLINYLGVEYYAVDKMTSSCDWTSLNCNKNESGFTALPGGMRFYDQETKTTYFADIGDCAAWWSSSEYYLQDAWGYGIETFEDITRDSSHYKGDGLSVRCIKD